MRARMTGLHSCRHHTQIRATGGVEHAQRLPMSDRLHQTAALAGRLGVQAQRPGRRRLRISVHQQRRNASLSPARSQRRRRRRLADTALRRRHQQRARDLLHGKNHAPRRYREQSAAWGFVARPCPKMPTRCPQNVETAGHSPPARGQQNGRKPPGPGQLSSTGRAPRSRDRLRATSSSSAARTVVERASTRSSSTLTPPAPPEPSSS